MCVYIYICMYIYMYVYIYIPPVQFLHCRYCLEWHLIEILKKQKTWRIYIYIYCIYYGYFVYIYIESILYILHIQISYVYYIYRVHFTSAAPSAESMVSPSPETTRSPPPPMTCQLLGRQRLALDRLLWRAQGSGKYPQKMPEIVCVNIT